MGDRIDFLVAVLSDKSANLAKRDDAAIALAAYTDLRALHALAKVGSDAKENCFYQETCGESITRIMIRTGIFDKEIILGLAKAAKDAALEFLHADKPEWYELVKSS